MRYQPPLPLPIDFALAIECCRAAFADEARPPLHRLTEQVDWDRFLATCRRHRVQGLVWKALHSLDLKIPERVGEALSGDARAIAEQGVRAAAESAALLAAFERVGIPLLFVKGLTLGALAYGDPFVKMGWDIDLLVPPEAVVEAGRELDRLGYRPVVPPTRDALGRWHRRSKESVWRKPDGAAVDLHSRLADHRRLVPEITASSPSQMVAVTPGIRLPTLADEELFAYLCVHGASSAWFRLKWITDLAGWLHRGSDHEVARLFERSQRLGAGNAAAQALLLANRLYDTPVDPGLSERLVNRWLAWAALKEMTIVREPTERPFGTLMIHLTQFFLLPGVGFKLSELRRQVGAARLKA